MKTSDSQNAEIVEVTETAHYFLIRALGPGDRESRIVLTRKQARALHDSLGRMMIREVAA